jgi:hypothetical protein
MLSFIVAGIQFVGCHNTLKIEFTNLSEAFVTTPVDVIHVEHP